MVPVEHQPPEVLALVIADHVHRDDSTGKFFILGTRASMGAAAFPFAVGAAAVGLFFVGAAGAGLGFAACSGSFSPVRNMGTAVSCSLALPT